MGREHDYEIKVVCNIIKGKESRGEDASYERELLRSWSKDEEWKNAGQALATLQSVRKPSK